MKLRPEIFWHLRETGEPIQALTASIFQNHRGAWNATPLISDDGRILIKERPGFWSAKTALQRLATDLTLQALK